MLKKLLDLFRSKPAVVETPPPAPAADTADVIKAAVQDKIAEAKPRAQRPRSPGKKTAKKKTA